MLSIVAALLATCLPRACAAAETPLETRSLYVNVENDGALITGLSPDHFRLYLNGQPLSFRLETPEAASIALVLEYSTTSWRGFQELNAPIRAFLERARKGDSYALAVYSRSLMVAFQFTRQASLLPEAHAALGTPLWSQINTYDAVYGMLEKLGGLPGRRILVLIGSGMDTLSGHTLEDVEKKIDAENITVFSVGTGTLFREAYGAALGPAAAARLAGAQQFLEMLATQSGGGAWFPSRATEVPGALDVVLQRIAAQYCLVYQAPRPEAGKLEPITVEAFGAPGEQKPFKVLAPKAWR